VASLAKAANDANLQRAIQHRLDAGVVPGKTMKWGEFCDQIRDDCGGWKDGRRQEQARGYGDKTIKRAVERAFTARAR
jgi:hypothetical protein